jgi:hypothetical protein
VDGAVSQTSSINQDNNVIFSVVRTTGEVTKKALIFPGNKINHGTPIVVILSVEQTNNA